jgi:hypothetical protein
MTKQIKQTDEQIGGLLIMSAIVITTYAHGLLDNKMNTQTAKLACHETLKELYPDFNDAQITLAVAHAMEVFISWQKYLAVKLKEANR